MGPTTAGICEDDDELRGDLRRALEREGYAVRATASGAEAIRSFAADPPDVLVLDIGLPDADGRDVCQALRARGVADAGPVPDRPRRADRPAERLSRRRRRLPRQAVRARRAARARRRALSSRRAGDAAPRRPATPASCWTRRAHAIVHGGSTVPLTPTEFRLLAALAARPEHVVRRSTLVAAAWPEGAIVHDNTLDAYMARLRRKLRDAGAPAEIKTARGVGYVLR